MDSFGDHALVCQCSGDRTVRHNRLRDVVCQSAGQGSLAPEREKAGLLPGRPPEDGVRSSDAAAAGDGQQRTARGRRPAD
eukprot:7285383-Karenia_brevis.AAC.1